MGNAGYQAITNRMLPLPSLAGNFNSLKSRLTLKIVNSLQPRIRAWARNRITCFQAKWPRSAKDIGPGDEFTIDSAEGWERDYFLQILLRHDWKAGGETAPWDVEKAGRRVLMATERGEGLAKRTLVRVWGAELGEIATLLHGAPVNRPR
jgi:hypothetical protein